MSTDEKIAAVLVLFAALVAFIIWAARRWLATRTDQAEFDADLDETSILELTHDETMRDLYPETGPGPGSEVTPDGTEVSCALPDEVAPAEAPERAERDLTPKQRRRAVHKGRIPRRDDQGPGTRPLRVAGSSGWRGEFDSRSPGRRSDLPAPDGGLTLHTGLRLDRAAVSREAAGTGGPRRGGESTERLISGILAAELDAGRWLAAEADRAREEETLRERAELDARIDEAYRVVGAGFADLEARNWLELAA